MAILRFDNGKTYKLALRYKAKEVEGQFGKQFQYFFMGGDIAYLPPLAHAEIDSLHLDHGQPFTILKTQTNGQAIQWTVERVLQPTPEPKPIQQAQTISSAPARPDLTTPQSRHLFRQLVATIEAVKAAEEFAQSIGRPVRFEEQDIRAMAISGFIESARRQAA